MAGGQSSSTLQCLGHKKFEEAAYRDRPEPLRVREPLIGPSNTERVLGQAGQEASTLDVLPDEVAQRPIDVVQSLQTRKMCSNTKAGFHGMCGTLCL
jgi:hypothetical protein